MMILSDIPVKNAVKHYNLVWILSSSIEENKMSPLFSNIAKKHTPKKWQRNGK